MIHTLLVIFFALTTIYPSSGNPLNWQKIKEDIDLARDMKRLIPEDDDSEELQKYLRNVHKFGDDEKILAQEDDIEKYQQNVEQLNKKSIKKEEEIVLLKDILKHVKLTKSDKADKKKAGKELGKKHESNDEQIGMSNKYISEYVVEQTLDEDEAEKGESDFSSNLEHKEIENTSTGTDSQESQEEITMTTTVSDHNTKETTIDYYKTVIEPKKIIIIEDVLKKDDKIISDVDENDIGVSSKTITDVTTDSVTKLGDIKEDAEEVKKKIIIIEFETDRNLIEKPKNEGLEEKEMEEKINAKKNAYVKTLKTHFE